MAFVQATPARPVPGAFFNTPAAQRFPAGADTVRRKLFSDADATQHLSTSGGALNGVSKGATGSGSTGRAPASVARALPAPENVAPITRAAKAINQSLQKDENFPDLDSYLRRQLCPVCRAAETSLTCLKLEHPPNMTSPATTPLGGPSTRRRCIRSRTRSSATTTRASSRR